MVGWAVEAEGYRVKQPGKMEFKVSSNIDWFELNGQVDFGGVTIRIVRNVVVNGSRHAMGERKTLSSACSLNEFCSPSL